ncbi:MAG: lytic transglycosylase domain-containing protein [Piscirickettsiaceae bacterium]|nr:lytic transglycosylase domain-containing protein [Piscirickettsiaceae bacterium]
MFLRLFLFSLCFGLVLQVHAAEKTKKIIHNDGSIEYTNRNLREDKTIIYKSEKDGILTISNIKPLSGTYKIYSFTCYACNPKSKIDFHSIKLNTTSYSDYINVAAQRYNVDPALVRALIHAESAFNPKARSKAGAQGLMQLMPATAKELGVTNALNAQQNINGGVKYLAQLLTDFNGNIKLATAAYNAGPNAVKKYNGVPPYSETQMYVKRVAILHHRYKLAS